jgi:hypothetical protein
VTIDTSSLASLELSLSKELPYSFCKWRKIYSILQIFPDCVKQFFTQSNDVCCSRETPPPVSKGPGIHNSGSNVLTSIMQDPETRSHMRSTTKCVLMEWNLVYTRSNLQRKAAPWNARV